MLDRNTRWAICALLVIAFVVRLICVLTREYTIGVDGSEYLALGQNIRLHAVYSYGAPHQWGDRGVLDSTGPFPPTAARAPLYPLMIAGLWWDHQPPLLAIRLAQAVLGSLTVLFVYLTALRVFGPRAALLAGLAIALGPLSSELTTTIVSESLFNFLTSASVWLWSKQRGVIAGLLLGAATLTRAIALPIVVLIGILAILFKFNRSLHTRIVLAALLVVVPWSVRNAITQHSIVPVSTMGWGANILLGTRPVTYGSGNPFLTYVKDDTFIEAIRTTSTEADAEKIMLWAGLERIRQAPLHWLWVRITQFPRLFVETPSYLFRYVPLPPPIVTGAYFLGTFLFLGLAATGMVMTLRRWRQTYPFALFIVPITALFFVGANEERYSLAILPMTAVFAGFALSALTRGKTTP